MKKRLFALLLAGMMALATPVTVSAKWEQDKNGTWSWTENAVKQTGWKYIGGYWYYFDNTGAMKTGWIKTSGKWYYLASSGAMLTNSFTPDNYWVDSNGVWSEKASKSVFDEDSVTAISTLLYLNRDIIENTIAAVDGQIDVCQAAMNGYTSVAFNEIQNIISNYRKAEKMVERAISYASQFKEFQTYTNILKEGLVYLQKTI